MPKVDKPQWNKGSIDREFDKLINSNENYLAIRDALYAVLLHTNMIDPNRRDSHTDIGLLLAAKELQKLHWSSFKGEE